MASVAASAAPAEAARATTGAAAPTVEVYAASGGIVSDGSPLNLSVAINNPSDAPVLGGKVSVSVTEHPLVTTAALTAFEAAPNVSKQRALGTASTAAVSAGSNDVVASVSVPAASVQLSSSAPGVFGLVATVTSSDGTVETGVGTLVVPSSKPSTVGVAAVMPITVPPGTGGLISSQDLANYTSPTGVLTRELAIAQHNPGLTLGIDPMILASIRVLGQSAPASAQSWLGSLDLLSNDTFPLQYGDADPGLQTQAGLSAPLQPTDLSYAMGNFSGELDIGEPVSGAAPQGAPHPTATPTLSPTPTPTPTTGSQLPPLSRLLGWQYTLGGIAWPAPDSVRSADIAAFGRAGMPTTIVSGSNTNAAKLSGTPNAAFPVSGGTVLVTDDALSNALSAAMSASDSISAATSQSALNAQLDLAAQNASPGGIVLASTGRIWPTDSSHAAAAVSTVLGSRFSSSASLRDALNAAPTSGLALSDKRNSDSRVDQAGVLLDLAGEQRSNGTPSDQSISGFSSALVTPALLTGQVRAQLLQLFSVGWDGSAAWSGAVTKQISAMNQTLSAVQIVSPESIRQASRQALIPITVTNKLDYPVNVVLRATPSSARLEVASDTQKTIPAGSSVKVLVPVKSQLSNGTVWLGLQLYSSTGVRIGISEGAEIDVHADWEGIGALIFGLIVVGFFGFGLFRTIQRRRRERDADPEDPEDPDPVEAPEVRADDEETRG